ncbi:HD-GYP domain-containing protein [Tepidanaerobacter acetatoxydans]|uniref:HD-GYP domain-containing protein n=1 Tax=Tepidanaerobacter acetatoxydans TaxID=499229 RepID=UPI00235B5D8A|nr:HD domain-containing phosphohydrolase [Tepidanaerobacter acetatoxydans]
MRAKLFASFLFKGSFYLIDIENEKIKDSLVIKTIDAAKAGFYKKYLIDHQFRVADTCLKMADSIGMGREDSYFLVQEALLHDVGKFFVPESLLIKKGSLSKDEFEKLKDHARLGAEYLEGRHFPEDITQAVRHHHERYDGQGYPDGLKGEKIPLSSRVIAVADAYDAMTYGRSYKAPMSQKSALMELEKNTSSQFDPNVVRAFKSLLEEREAVLECLR